MVNVDRVSCVVKVKIDETEFFPDEVRIFSMENISLNPKLKF
jgi:hypothetical protein